MNKMRWFALCTAMLFSGMSFVGCNSKAKNPDPDSVAEISDSTEETIEETKELVPNAESDFLWHALTADEVADAQYVGGVVITGYVGDSEDVVIPKAIDNKPVVAIGEFAFSPYRYDDFRYYGEFEGGFSKQAYPLAKLAENTGILDEYETIYNKMNADEHIQEAYHDSRFSAYIRYLLEGEGNAEKLPSEVFNQFESWCQSYTPEQLHFFNGYKEYADEGSSVSVFLLDNTNNLRSDDNEGYLNIIRSDVLESMKDYEHVSDLKSVMLPNTIALIGGGAFAYCDSLEKVCVYDAKEGEIPFIDDTVWTDVEGMRNHQFLEGHQFTACTNLKETNFYLDVDDCGSQCYQFCINLETAYIAPAENNALTMAYCVPDSQHLKHVYVSDDCQSISAAVSYKLYDTSACTFHLPSSVTEIGEDVFCQHNNKSGDYYMEGGPEETACEFNGVEIITPEGSYAEQYAKEHGIKVNGVLHEVVKPTEVPTEPPTESETCSTAEWQSHYLAIIEQAYKDGYIEDTYALINLNDDDIPELVTNCVPIEYSLKTYVDGKVIDIPCEGSFEGYIPRTGVYATQTITFDLSDSYYREYVYENSESIIKRELFSHPIDYTNGTCEYYIDGASATKEEYDAEYRSLCNSYSEPVYYDYQQMKDILMSLTSEYVPQNEVASSEDDILFEEIITGTIITEEDALNVRTGPSTEYAKLGTVPKGATVYIKGKDGDWYIIEYGTDTGYVLKDYVALD